MSKNLLSKIFPYPSRRDDQKSRDKASNQMEKIFQIFQDLRFDISFADALLLMPRFAPTIKSLLMNKEKSCCSLDKDILSLPELTPTRMTLELADRSITRPKGVAEDIFVKVRNFHIPTDFVVVDFEADPRVPLILGRSFLRTSRALIDVYEGELVLRDGNEQITFHVDGTSKHPQKHINESIKIVNDTCKNSFKRFTDEPALVCLPPLEDDNNEKEKQEVKNLAEPTAKRQTRMDNANIARKRSKPDKHGHEIEKNAKEPGGEDQKRGERVESLEASQNQYKFKSSSHRWDI
ncbi:reverse transcriptase domain-containing protein [Tanacetum coccineum]